MRCKYSRYELEDLAKIGNPDKARVKKRDILITEFTLLEKKLKQKISGLGRAAMLFCEENITFDPEELDTAQAAYAQAVQALRIKTEKLRDE